MATKPANQLRQVYDIREGVIDLKIVTARGLSGNELSDYREALFFESRMARQLPDLIQDLNEVKPAVLHFSGHGSKAELVFEDEHGNTHTLDNEMLGKLLRAAPAGIRLAVFNSCESAAQAQIAVQYVDAAIGMNTMIDDVDAKIFAGQLYNSLGFGLSLADASRQRLSRLRLRAAPMVLPRLSSFARRVLTPRWWPWSTLRPPSSTRHTFRLAKPNSRRIRPGRGSLH